MTTFFNLYSWADIDQAIDADSRTAFLKIVGQSAKGLITLEQAESFYLAQKSLDREYILNGLNRGQYETLDQLKTWNSDREVEPQELEEMWAEYYK